MFEYTTEEKIAILAQKHADASKRYAVDKDFASYSETERMVRHKLEANNIPKDEYWAYVLENKL